MPHRRQSPYHYTPIEESLLRSSRASGGGGSVRSGGGSGGGLAVLVLGAIALVAGVNLFEWLEQVWRPWYGWAGGGALAALLIGLLVFSAPARRFLLSLVLIVGGGAVLCAGLLLGLDWLLA